MRRDDVSLVGGAAEPQAHGDEGVGRIEPAPRASGYGALGDRVAGILRAAEVAAAELRADAAADAEETRRAAHAEAEEITRAARDVRAQAEEYASDIRLAVEAYANAHRREAEAEARRLRASAEEEARAIREAAETMAERLDEDARGRREALVEENRVLDERRRRTVETLRDLAADLEDLVTATGGDGRAAEADEPSQSLGDALSLRRRR